ncbi:MAG: methylenetetrahydrofolate reductase [NAD(P)H] [Kiritimatiellae bacterium]|nr:methylenetetrahydrofolate reductase [NAD(P)H] [Kiritimatiellia bacterium]
MSETRVMDLLEAATRPLFSLEFFPPKNRLGFGLLGGAIERMRAVTPDFVSVTYGAGGSTRERTLDACDLLHKMSMGPVVAHLTCVGSSRADLEAIVDDFYARGYRNIMCLRGDPPQGETSFQAHPEGLVHAGDLVALVKSMHPDVCCGVAGYPEKHPEAESLDRDVEHLKEKVDAGASFITTQMFFDNAHYFRFVEKCRALGITQPIIPGLMPVISRQQIDRITSLSDAEFPEELARSIDEAGGSGPRAEALGMEWTVHQVENLLSAGAPGVHLYILNRAPTATSPILTHSLSAWRR